MRDEIPLQGEQPEFYREVHAPDDDRKALIDWYKYPSDRNNIAEALRSVIRPDNYGFEPGNWNLTEILHAPQDYKYASLHIIEGSDGHGNVTLGAEMKATDGGPLSFRLHVLSRQAIKRAVHGVERFKPTDPAQPGDIVEWKSHVRLDKRNRPADADTRLAWAEQGIRPHKYDDFTCDNDCCIRVGFVTAIMMLERYGLRSSHPQFDRLGRRDNARGVMRITNWRFQEVAADWHNPDRGKGGRK